MRGNEMAAVGKDEIGWRSTRSGLDAIPGPQTITWTGFGHRKSRRVSHFCYPTLVMADKAPSRFNVTSMRW
jgi:hypothetical protein